MANPYAKQTWTDEILSGAERYDILENGGGAFKANMQINLATGVSVAGSPVNATRMNTIEVGVQALSDLLQYKIAPSTSSNNLTVALQHADGTAPSASRALWVKIDGVWYSFTGATSYTKNAGTNWHNVGESELAAQAIDFFVYAIAETGASAGAKIGHSRIAHARTMADFVNTTTNEKYIAGNWTNFNSSDKVELIGRFRAQLSASTAFNWSIASALVVNSPIYETDWLTFAPTLTGFSANPTNTIYQYKVTRSEITVRVRQATNGTSNANTFSMTAPFTALTLTNAVWLAVALQAVDNNAVLTTPALVQISSAGTSISLFKDASSAVWTTSSGKRAGYFELKYPIA